MSFFIKILLLFLYCLLIIAGIVTFILGLHPLEIIFKKKDLAAKYIVITNFLIGLGLVFGRIQRTNSWDIFLNFPKFIFDTLRIFSSAETILLAIAFGILCNILYFSCRHFIMKEIHEIEKI